MIDGDSIVQGIASRQQSALPAVVGNIDESPDDAQRAYDLAKVTGAPASAIYGDLDGFERQHKAAMASSIVANNSHLADFVQSGPMVPKLANDDYGNLDSVSQKVSAMSLPMRILRAPEALASTLFDGDPLKRWKEGGPLGSWLSDDDFKNHPVASAVAAGIGTPIELLLRGVGSTIETAADVAAKVSPDFGALVEAEGMGLTGRHGMEAPPAANLMAARAGKYVDIYNRAKPWLENGREPPPTALPEYDEFRAKQNAQDVDALKEATGEAQKSLLRERNPELFKQFIDQHTDAEIGVSGEAVAKLYGDKEPTTDDNLLGWVPGIKDKLDLARTTGDDISIPLSDWLAKAEPELMQALHDDIRVRLNGLTANEVKLQSEADAANPPPVPLTDEVAQTRAAAALEPLLSVGDRKLKIERLAGAEGSRFGPEQGFHDFSMNDEKGNPVGTINLSEQRGGKDLYVEMINGIGGLGPRDFGPRLMLDLLRQLKQEFPNAERLGGHRVSGAREAAGKEMTMPAAWIKLDVDAEGNRVPKGWGTAETFNEFRRILEGGQWHNFSPTTKAYIKPDAARTLEDRKIFDAIKQELDRIVPSKVRVGIADRIVAGAAQGQAGAVEPSGIYIRYRDQYPVILASLEAPDALGTAQHEAIHHLRNYGFFSKEEWATLEKASIDNGWMEKFGTHRQYPTGSLPLKLEESIAEGYRDWLRGADAPSPEVHTIFEKIKAFFEAVKQRIAQLIGKDNPTWEDIFQKVDTGEVGSREGKPLDPRAFDEKLSVPEEPEGGPRVFERANALGMTVDQFKRYDELIAQRHAEDIEAATKRAQDQKSRELTKQWKDDRKALRVEVAADIKQRPDVAADLLLGAGELYGKKVGKVKLDSDALTDAQKAMLPRDYYGKDGLHPDDVASLFGYGSGDAMVQKLGEYNVAKTLANMSAKDYVSRVTDMETDRQMRIKYGVLDDNIMDAVKEQVTGETQLNLLHEETLKLGLDAGKSLLDKPTVLAQLRDQFAKMPLGSVSSDKYMAAAGKAGRAAELALLNGDPEGAFRAKQQQYYATVIAREAAGLERELGKFDKLAKRFSKREVPAVDQQYTNFIHDILLRVGRPVRRSVQDLAGEIAAGEYKSLQEFVEGKQSFYLREVAVADMLFDPGFRKGFDDLTVDEFRAVDTSVKSLLANGRDEKKITKAGAEADLAEVKGQMINQLQEFQERTYDAKGGRWMGPIPPKIAKVIRTYGIAHIQMENLFNRWDHDNPQGVFQQYIMRDLVDAANNESVMEKRYAEKLRGLDDKADLKRGVDNSLFKVPGSDNLMQFTRANLRAILLNAGNTSNLDKMARGYKLQPGEVLAWLHRHATKEDWDWAQKMGDIFAEIKGEADVMYRNLSGVAPESIKLAPIDTPHGQYPGWYYPLIAHPEFEGPTPVRAKNALEQQGFARATAPNGYTKARTGATYPLALDLDAMPARMKQMLHDIAMRPAIINASKIFYDKDIKAAVFKHFGAEWRDMLEPYLVDVANSANYMPKDQRTMAAASEFLRQNLISTLVGLNPGTVLKHGPTALAQSMHEVGSVNFLRAMKSLFSINDRTGETNWQFAMKESDELQRRHQNYVETIGGATDLLQDRTSKKVLGVNVPTTYSSLRNTIQRFAASPVAMSDLLSAVPTWLAQYDKSMADNGGIHGDAVYDANRAVRRAHGSVAITNRSGVMRGGALAQWFSSVYGFFNHIMNRQYEMLWKAGEMVGDAKEGNYAAAMQRAPQLTSMLFAYVIAPAIIEEMVTPLISTDNESWGKKAAKGVAFTLGASWVGIRDIANALLNGRDPSVGLLSTAAKTITDFGRDLRKDRPLGREHAGKLVRDGSTLLGALTGVVPGQVGKTAQFGTGVAEGTERPKGPWGWLVGARYGTLKGHSQTFNEWQRHH